ncbi:hypothetical protein OG196_11195 [Kitasatospora purpeofusca]|uniref:hypothetical protein n=1 Tax=Kitasatospora purpeofusca TaxID=67352 RepID=UPI002E14EB53|nr:hypothetical protein OG196_11195 [Kitasatospora purpeofusca]
MNRRIRTRVVLAATAVAVVAGTFTAGVGVARAGDAPGHRGKATEREIAGLFEQWNAALRSGDPGKVAERYAEDPESVRGGRGAVISTPRPGGT